MHLHTNCNFSQQSNCKSPLVLVVDNDYDNLLLAGCVIESMGFNCAMTHDSEDCLSLVKELVPDLILLDIVMPKINGLEIARKLKQDKNLSVIPIIAVTGLAYAQDRHRILKAGFDDYLIKPYLIDNLEKKLQALLKAD